MTNEEFIKLFEETMYENANPVILETKTEDDLVYYLVEHDFYKKRERNWFILYNDDADIELYLPNGPYVFSIDEYESEINMSITPQSYWNNDNCMYDQHMSAVFEFLSVEIDMEIDEVSENVMIVESTLSIEQIKQEMIDAGFIFDQSYQNYCSSYLNDD